MQARTRTHTQENISIEPRPMIPRERDFAQIEKHNKNTNNTLVQIERESNRNSPTPESNYIRRASISYGR